MTELQLRTISGIIMATVFLVAVLMGGWFFTLFVGCISLIVWHEWSEISMTMADDRLKLFGFLALLLSCSALMFFVGILLFLVLISVFLLSLVFMFPLSGGKTAIIGLIYAGSFMISLVMLRGTMDFVPGLVSILYLCTIVWLTDIGAYFIGRTIKGPRLAPSVSPNKTISGALGGIALAALGAIIISQIANLKSGLTLILMAVFLSLISQYGDLFESWFKRRFGKKDSGSFIPGHGGAMDRVDGLVFASVSLWILSSLSAGFTKPALTFFN